MTRRKFFVVTAAVLTAALFLTVAVTASETQWWRQSTRLDFSKGDLKGAAVSSDGRLIPAPALKEIYDSGEAFIYSAHIDRASNIYLGTGNNGKLFRVSAAGEGALWAELEESGIFALAADSTDRIYAATAPDGKVYSFDSQGESSVYFDPGQKYIWSLAMDAQNNLYLGTGPRGRIYRVDSSGQGSLFYDSSETHIMSLAFDLDGNLLAGTAPNGLILRLTPQGAPSVVMDSDLSEIQALAVDRIGLIYAAALSETTKVDTGSGQDSAQGDEEGAETVETAGIKAGKGLEVYRVDRDGLVDQLYSSDSQSAFDLKVRSDGSVLIAAGPEGRILSVDGDRFVTYLADTREEQVTQLLERDGNLFAATSNLGKLLRLETSGQEPGSFESEVLDAKAPSRWGRIRWRSVNPDPPVRVRTRSGNTSDPDETWSSWSEAYPDSQGSPVQSPLGRYLQYKVEFPRAAYSGSITSPSQAIEEVAVSYLQNNLAPQIGQLTVHPAGKALTPMPNVSGAGASPGGPDGAHALSLPRSVRNLEGMSPQLPPRTLYVPGARSFSWEAQDPNQDELEFNLHIRRQGEDTWTPVEEKLRRSYYALDTASLPDGQYFLRLTANDRLSNPPANALQSELTSKAFTVANRGPQVELSAPVVDGRQAQFNFTATATSSSLHQAEYQVGGGEWVIVLPQDGITDGGQESYSVSLSDLPPGNHSLSVRVVDEVGNVATRRETLRIR
ncbi:MAG TPA: hypothetical protein VLV83_03225 [Acidobacteriota bacterium]|nr:hypothetical protein [Acidobacteriota bacterium]